MLFTVNQYCMVLLTCLYAYMPIAGWEDVGVRFLCGADLLESFSVPGLWKDKDVSVGVYTFAYNTTMCNNR